MKVVVWYLELQICPSIQAFKNLNQMVIEFSKKIWDAKKKCKPWLIDYLLLRVTMSFNRAKKNNNKKTRTTLNN